MGRGVIVIQEGSDMDDLCTILFPSHHPLYLSTLLTPPPCHYLRYQMTWPSESATTAQTPALRSGVN